jgi:transposase
MSKELAVAEQALAGALDFDAMGAAIAAQPDLFRDFSAVQVVRATRNYLHTGRAVTDDEKVAAKVAALRAGGFSLRAIAKQTGYGRNTITAAVEELERQGKVEPAKEVVGRRLGMLVEDQMERVSELLGKSKLTDGEVGELKAGWVGVGVGLTHMGAAKPAVVQHQHIHAVMPASPVDEYLKSLQASSAMQADGFDRKPLISSVELVCDSLHDSDGCRGSLADVVLQAGSGGGASITESRLPPGPQARRSRSRRAA